MELLSDVGWKKRSVVKSNLLKAIAVSVLIALSSYLYMNVEDRSVASFLFRLTRKVVFKEGLDLYAGKVGARKSVRLPISSPT